MYFAGKGSVSEGPWAIGKGTMRTTLGCEASVFARVVRPCDAISPGAGRRAINAPGAAMTAWIVWLIVAAVLGVAELLTTTFALGILAVAALVAAGVGAGHLGVPLQLTAFVVSSGAGLGFVLPVARRHVKQPPLLRTGPAALV